MSSHADDKIDEVADGLDDLKTTIEELAEDANVPVDREAIDNLKDTVEKAREQADDLENQSKGSAS